jgi:hypothetical protein
MTGSGNSKCIHTFSFSIKFQVTRIPTLVASTSLNDAMANHALMAGVNTAFIQDTAAYNNALAMCCTAGENRCLYLGINMYSM